MKTQIKSITTLPPADIYLCLTKEHAEEILKSRGFGVKNIPVGHAVGIMQSGVYVGVVYTEGSRWGIKAGAITLAVDYCEKAGVKPSKSIISYASSSFAVDLANQLNGYGEQK